MERVQYQRVNAANRDVNDLDEGQSPAEAGVGAGAGSVHLFAYGTLAPPGALEGVLGRSPDGERLRATLRGYRRVALTEAPYPSLVPEPGSFVEGILLMGLTAGDLALLDEYEDVDDGLYERRPVVVETRGCGPHVARVPAQVYVAGPRARIAPCSNVAPTPASALAPIQAAPAWA